MLSHYGGAHARDEPPPPGSSVHAATRRDAYPRRHRCSILESAACDRRLALTCALILLCSRAPTSASAAAESCTPVLYCEYSQKFCEYSRDRRESSKSIHPPKRISHLGLLHLETTLDHLKRLDHLETTRRTNESSQESDKMEQCQSDHTQALEILGLTTMPPSAEVPSRTNPRHTPTHTGPHIDI